MGNRFVGRTGTNSDWVLYIRPRPKGELRILESRMSVFMDHGLV